MVTSISAFWIAGNGLASTTNKYQDLNVTLICSVKNEKYPILKIHKIMYRRVSTLAQVMACCLTTRSHYLAQCWLLISVVLWHSPQSNFTTNAQVTILYNESENYNFQITTTSPWGQWILWLTFPINTTHALLNWRISFVYIWLRTTSGLNSTLSVKLAINYHDEL